MRHGREKSFLGDDSQVSVGRGKMSCPGDVAKFIVEDGRGLVLVTTLGLVWVVGWGRDPVLVTIPGLLWGGESSYTSDNPGLVLGEA